MDKKEYLALIKTIKEHDTHYYDEHEAVISDREYDRLVKLLESIEEAHPEWISKSSPS